MKDIIREACYLYNSFVAQAELDVFWAKEFLNAAQLERIKLARMRTKMVENWLKMLTADERFAIEKHFFEDLEWNRVAHVFGKEWDCQFFRSVRNLGTHQANALKKIESFCHTYEELIRALFEDMSDTEHLVALKNEEEKAKAERKLRLKQQRETKNSDK